MQEQFILSCVKEKTRFTLQRIADTLEVNHATVLHAINNVFPVIEREEPLLYEIYNKLKKRMM